MDNQHKMIKGYRDLSQDEIDLMNDVKSKGEEVRALIVKLEATNSLDHRWLAIGTTDLQKGFMSLVRSIAQTESF